ncbi:helix-turn-helix transcriptional regulator [Azospira restricta]|uniref:YafY family transcriptional regulator n=1 Tax=Azospira restricta TaxID=404405 RepID=A0A974PW50_9RHOO|nr:YafY family protein [Azospira restricta]QRJ62163.1 YafY family transcriptional regulator [Azospira restricta]
MDRTERLYKIDLLLNEQPGIPFAALQARLEVSRATLKRDLSYMKDRLNAPIVFDRFAGGYRFDSTAAAVGDQYELPGLWFSAEEIHALLTMQHLLANLDTGGLLGPHIRPLLARLTALLGTGDNSAEEIEKRIFVLNVGNREFHLDHFEAVGSALLRRKRLRIDYFAKGKGELSQREVSPQRLVYYRNNWYLDAWCHLREDIRAFALDSIRRGEILEKKAKEVPAKSLDAVLGAGYGIFSGREVRWATLRFTPERARWVAGERWHPQQRGRLLRDGSYELKLPYTQDPELLMDILKFGAGCEVLAPRALRERVATEAAKLARIYAVQA